MNSLFIQGVRTTDGSYIGAQAGHVEITSKMERDFFNVATGANFELQRKCSSHSESFWIMWTITPRPLPPADVI
jgi:hypothetical protein